ncbi:unnamed protein product, partial [Meganyctiphanes norvegica]
QSPAFTTRTSGYENSPLRNMKIRCIIVIAFCCVFSHSELNDAKQVQHFVIKSPVAYSIDNTDEILEINTSVLLRKKEKTMSARNCIDLKNRGKKSGVYLITPCDISPTKVVEVYCDMDTDEGGWTVIQRRDNYTQQQDFYNIWYEYAIGFGNTSKDFWLGNDNINCLTQQSHHEIRFDLEDLDGNSRYAKYGFFYIDDRTNLYKLAVQDYKGDAGDSFSYHNNYKFSTFDADNDIHGDNCAERFKGGWWYGECHNANLNGLYLNGSHSSYADGVNWETFKGDHYSLKKSEIKIRSGT